MSNYRESLKYIYSLTAIVLTLTLVIGITQVKAVVTLPATDSHQMHVSGSSWSSIASAPTTASIMFESFDNSTSIYQINPGEAEDQIRDLWKQNDDNAHGGVGVQSINQTDSATGTGNSLQIDVQESMLQASLYPYLIVGRDGFTGYEWLYTRELINLTGAVEASNWDLDTYNRMKFWVKMPAGLSQLVGGRSNFIWGTYQRSTSAHRGSAESDNMHFYHNFNPPYTGEWHQFIVDWHPNHQRGESGDTDHGEKQYPTSEAGYNYFDLLTHHYFDIDGGAITAPFTVLIDDVEFYRDDNSESIAEIYSLNGVYRASDNYLFVGWMANKANSPTFDVRYAFTDIHALGWDNATVAPSGTAIPRPGGGGYNAVEYTTNAIDGAGQENLYVAVKPSNESGFRQIIIPTREQ